MASEPAGGTGPELEPQVGRYLRLEHEGRRYRIYFEEAGAGIPLLCLHTAGAHSSQFRHLMGDPGITAHFRVIAFDMPWHGKSHPLDDWPETPYRLTGDFYAALVMRFAQEMGLERPVVLGCSMGGRLVIRLAAEEGHRLGGVIGLESTDTPAPWYDDAWLDHPRFVHGDFCAALVSGLVAPGSPPAFRAETLWHYHQSGTGIFRGDMHFFRTGSDYRALAARIDTSVCPVYLMTGEYDFSCTPEATRAVIDREAPGLAEAMRLVNPLGRLSRGIAGTVGTAIVLNTPGSPAGAVECLDAVIDILPHALRLLAGE